jgi:hypothetical protein
MPGKKECRRCEAMTVSGKRCKNKIACQISCTKYCHVHSKGYPKNNKKCVIPEIRYKYK